MIELLKEYSIQFLWTDSYQITGVAMTLWLLVASILIGASMALPLSVARNAHSSWINLPVRFYTYVFRGTPLYIQLLICYSGIYSFSVVRDQPLLNAFFRNGLNCTILAFALNTCAYTTEIFAGAMRNIPYGEVEAAKAFGFSGWRIYVYLILPSALRRALPYYSNEVILMLHATTVAFAATVPDILKIARDANAATYMTFESFGIAAALYLMLSFMFVGIFRVAERRWLAFLDYSR